MRFSVLGSLLLLASLGPVLAAPTSEGAASTSEQAPETSRSSPEPTTSTPRTTSPPTSTPTSSSEQSTTSSASAPTGGGQSCVQSCMALAASDAGCNGFTDSQCVCANSGFLADAQQCFTAQNCDPAAVTGAVREYSSVCRNLSSSSDSSSTTDTSSSTSSDSTTTSWPTVTVPHTPSPSRSVPDRTATVLETIVIQSGAVITVSGSVYTAGAALTTTFSGQFGDFAGGAGVGTLGANDGSASGTARPNSEMSLLVVGRALPITAMSLAVGVLIGGLTCLVF